MEITQNMTISEKLKILTDAAKYDVACTSSGVDRGNKGQGIGDTHACGICHTFSADGRCVSFYNMNKTCYISVTGFVKKRLIPNFYFFAEVYRLFNSPTTSLVMSY